MHKGQLLCSVIDQAICPFHGSELGIGWRRNSSACQVPSEIANTVLEKVHKHKGEQRSGEGGIEAVIFQKTGVLVPVGLANETN